MVVYIYILHNQEVSRGDVFNTFNLIIRVLLELLEKDRSALRSMFCWSGLTTPSTIENNKMNDDLQKLPLFDTPLTHLLILLLSLRIREFLLLLLPSISFHSPHLPPLPPRSEHLDLSIFSSRNDDLSISGNSTTVDDITMTQQSLFAGASSVVPHFESLVGGSGDESCGVRRESEGGDGILR